MKSIKCKLLDLFFNFIVPLILVFFIGFGIGVQIAENDIQSELNELEKEKLRLEIRIMETLNERENN